PFSVSGILADYPDNSSITYDLVIRFEHADNYSTKKTAWDHHNHDVYVQLPQGSSAAAFEKKLPPFIKQYFADAIDKLKRDGAVAAPDGSFIQLHLQPLTDIHTNTIIHSEGNPVSRSYLILLLVIGVLIVTIACINFINLSIGRSFTRSREIGLRKT